MLVAQLVFLYKQMWRHILEKGSLEAWVLNRKVNIVVAYSIIGNNWSTDYRWQTADYAELSSLQAEDANSWVKTHFKPQHKVWLDVLPVDQIHTPNSKEKGGYKYGEKTGMKFLNNSMLNLYLATSSNKESLLVSIGYTSLSYKQSIEVELPPLGLDNPFWIFVFPHSKEAQSGGVQRPKNLAWVGSPKLVLSA